MERASKAQMSRLAVLLAVVSLPLAAQLPYPGGGVAGPYPPMGGVKIPRPHKHHKKKKGKANPNQNQTIIAATGTTVSNDGQKLVVHVPDGRWLTMSITPDTKFVAAGTGISAAQIVPRTRVHVEAAEDEHDYLTAVTVELLKPKPAPAEAASKAAPSPSTDTAASAAPETPSGIVNPPDSPGAPILRPAKSEGDSASASAGETPSGIVNPPEAPGAPILRPGKPKHSSTTQSAAAKPNGDFDFTISSPTPSLALRQHFDALIQKARHWVANFTQGLPNYLCNQDTTRYVAPSRDSGWQAQDVVTAKVAYDQGHEEYSDITVGGKRTKKSMMDIGGTSSTGEFASMLYSLFDPGRETQFQFKNFGSNDGVPIAMYHFKVSLPRSDWTIIVGGQTLRPVYTGSVWINKKSAVVRRIEMKAENIPHDFPFSYVETAVDYSLVSLGTQQFLLPVHASNVACERDSSICTKNTIEFRNYRKFEGSSTIHYGK